jgi:hypothetical protein
MPRAGFEPATPTTKRPQTYAVDRAATGIGNEESGKWETLSGYLLNGSYTKVSWTAYFRAGLCETALMF